MQANADLRWKSAHSSSFSPSLPIEEDKVGNAADPVLGHFWRPLGVFNVQHHKVDSVFKFLLDLQGTQFLLTILLYLLNLTGGVSKTHSVFELGSADTLCQLFNLRAAVLCMLSDGKHDILGASTRQMDFVSEFITGDIVQICTGSRHSSRGLYESMLTLYTSGVSSLQTSHQFA